MKKKIRLIISVILACAVLVLCACETDEAVVTELPSCTEDTTSVPPEVEAEQVQYPDGTRAWRFFTWQERPEEPQSNIDTLSLDTTDFCGNGENLEYIDNLTLQSNTDGTYTLSFQLFQDALPYIEPLFLLLNSTVTLSYEGERFDALDTANEHTLFLLNGEKATVTEVRSGAGNGHRDFYFILQPTDPIAFEDLYSFEFVIS